MNKHVSFNSAAFMHSKLVNDSRIVSKNEFSLVLNINDDDEQEI